MSDLWNLGVCVIFAREFMEGAIIVGEYRTAIQRSEVPPDGPSKAQLLRNVNLSAAFAAFVAIMVVVIVAIPLAVLSHEFDEKTAEIIEGVSKIVAAFCILQLSLKMPKWLGFYKKRDQHGKVDDSFDITLRSVRFNVAWNVWREVAECGVFLLPFLLQGDEIAAIPLSALAGIVIGLTVGTAIYWANKTLTNKLFLAVFTTGLLVFLAAGLFVGGCHEFEEVLGETRVVWEAHNEFWSSSRIPMVLLKPFGYSSERTVLTVCAFWLFLALAAALHIFMIWRTKKVEKELAAEVLAKKADVEAMEKGESPDTSEADEVVKQASE